jgi:CheY-like chemotaxis protein
MTAVLQAHGPRGMLSRQGYDVREAASAKEALELVPAAAPDLVISDWMMPGMNGLEFCRHFRRWRATATGISSSSPRRPTRRM